MHTVQGSYEGLQHTPGERGRWRQPGSNSPFLIQTTGGQGRPAMPVVGVRGLWGRLGEGCTGMEGRPGTPRRQPGGLAGRDMQRLQGRR